MLIHFTMTKMKKSKIKVVKILPTDPLILLDGMSEEEMRKGIQEINVKTRINR